MKEKFKRRRMSHLGSNVDNFGKVERSMLKSMRRESTHFLNASSWFTFAAIAGVFSKIFRFLFNNTSGSEYGMPTFRPVLPELVRQNNSNKRWYKTHVPKLMRKGLTNLETTQLRQKVYAGHVRYV